MPRCHSWCNGLCPSCYQPARRDRSGRFPSDTRARSQEDSYRYRGGRRARSISPSWTEPRTRMQSPSYGVSPPRTVLQPARWPPTSGPPSHGWLGYMAPGQTSAHMEDSGLYNPFLRGGPQPIYDYSGWSYPPWDTGSNATRRRRSSDLGASTIAASPAGSTIRYGAGSEMSSPTRTRVGSPDGSSSAIVTVRLPTRYMDLAMFRYFDDLFQERFDRENGRGSGRRSGRARSGW